MSTAVSLPRVTLNNISPTFFQGLDDQRVLIVGQMTSGTATAGELDIDVPRTPVQINERYGADSHIAMLARWFRKINKYTNVDVMPLADHASATKGTATLTLSGTASREGRYDFLVAGPDHFYQVDVLVGDTPATVLSRLLARINVDTSKPFTAAVAGSTLTLTAANGGNLSDDWPVVISGQVTGLTAAVTGFTGGASDPVISTVFDAMENIRYQGIVWPGCYNRDVLKAFVDGRWNVTNNVMDGRAFIGVNESFVAAKASAMALNSSQICLLGNEPNALTDRRGPHLPEAPDLTATYFTAVRALRFETDKNITNVVQTKASDDQFGGIHTASLPYFNTPFIQSRSPKRGTGFSQEEQVELEEAGVTVIGMNDPRTGIVAGPVVTTRLTDGAGNQDPGSKYLNWIDTMSVVREYQVKNVRAEFSQSRMTIGQDVARKDVLTVDEVRSYIMLLLKQLAREALVVEGREAFRWMRDRLDVQALPESRTFKISEQVLLVSQAENFIGNIEYSFSI